MAARAGHPEGGFTAAPDKTFNRGYTELMLDGRGLKLASIDAAKAPGEPGGGIAAVRGRERAGADGLLVALSRLPEMDVDVGEAFADQLAAAGHPLLGDGTYGAPSPDKGLEGQCLHARRLRFLHPADGRLMELETPLPDYFEEILRKLGKQEDER